MKIKSIETEKYSLRFLETISIYQKIDYVSKMQVQSLKLFLKKIGVRGVKKTKMDLPFCKVNLSDMNQSYDVQFKDGKPDTKSISKLGSFYKDLRSAGMLPYYPFVGYYSMNLTKTPVEENIYQNVFDAYANVLDDHLSINIINTLLFIDACKNELLLDGKGEEEVSVCKKIEDIFKFIIRGMQSVIISQKHKNIFFVKNGAYHTLGTLEPFERFMFLFLCDFIIRLRWLANNDFETKCDYTENNGILIFDGGGEEISNALSVLHDNFPRMQFIHFFE